MPIVKDKDLAEVCATVLERTVSDLGGQERPQQAEMVAAVASALEGGRNLMVQAGTGVGKSFGYLIPLMTRSATTGGHQLIATSSLALQRQILTKDAPVVAQAVAAELGASITYAPLKGWANYLCRYRLSGGYGAQDALWEDRDSARTSAQQLQALKEWAQESECGDRDDVPFAVGQAAWRHASVSKRECLGRKCPFIEECFPAAAREKALAADVVITNHALLGIYVNGRPDVLPAFEAVVVDEAHDLVPRVRSQGTNSLSPSIVRRASRSMKAVSSAGAERLMDVADILEAALEGVDEGLVTLRSESLSQAMSGVDQAVRDSRQDLRRETEGADDAALHLARAALDDLEGVLDAWSTEPEKTITWVSVSQVGYRTLNLAPLGVESLLAKNLFSDVPAILTSATLTIGGDFKATLRQTGMEWGDNDCECLDVGTSFEPAAQGILYVASHLDEPGRDGRQNDFLEEMVDLIRASNGGVLGLFSSRSGAEAAAEYVRSQTDFEVLVQGEDALPTLVSRFREGHDTCLFGTISLWQGVDVPGPSCRLVIIDRIPFPRPNDPVTQARSRAAAQGGRNAFMEVSLAPAALLMAQGAGRLLRSSEDRGVVAVLDSRLTTKRYGEYIRRSMPPLWPTNERQVVLGALGRLSQSQDQVT